MANNRKNIRDAVVTMLSGNTAAGTNVYANRETRLWQSELPAILVYTRDESAESRDLSGRQSIRTLDLVIEIKAEANDTIDDDLDDLATEVEDIISADRSLTGTAIAAVYKGTTLALDSDSEIEKGVATITYETKYIG